MAAVDIQEGERSGEEKKKIVEKYSNKWSQYYTKLERKLDEYTQRCSNIQMRSDFEMLRINVLFDCLAYGFMPDEYFAYELENKSMEEKISYLSNTELLDIVYHLNDIVDLGIYFDKYKTYKKFEKYYGREAVCIEKQSDFTAFNSFIKKHNPTQK